MSRPTATQTQQQKPTPAPTTGGILQRNCACGNHTIAGGECAECGKTKRFGLQAKLKVNEPGDIYEQEADRIADQVMATLARSTVSGIQPGIQRFAGQPTRHPQTAPASVDHALASPGRPLDPALRLDMEQRFGYDFSRVRVHSGAAVEQSAREVNAHAYTVGQNIVFGAGPFAPGTREGQRLIAHELTHVVQQSDAETVLFRQSNEESPSIVNSPSQMEPSQFDGGRTLRNKARRDTPYAEPTVRVPMDSPGNPNEVAADFAASEAVVTGSPAGDQLTSPTDGAAPSDGGADLPASLAAEIIRPSGGTALPSSLCAEQEARLGCALSHVRIHQGARATALAEALDARAFTYGSDIWLGAGETIADHRLMTHELTHVAQQEPRPLRDAASKGGESYADRRIQATNRYYWALPRLGKGSRGSGDRSHDHIQEILGKDTENQPIFSEVPIPEGASTGSTGRADVLKTDTGTYFGVKFTGNSPAFLSLSEKSLLNGAKASDATHRDNAAPAGNTGIEGGKACASRGLPPAQGICRVDEGPKTVSIADIKPNYEAEVLLGGAQVDRYVAKVNELSTKVNSFATTSPTLIHPAGKNWSVSAQRMKGIHIPPAFESPTASSRHVEVVKYVNDRPKEPEETAQAVLQIAQKSDGFITYEYLPLGMLGTGAAAGGAGTATSTITEAKTKIGPVKTELKKEPKAKRVATLSRPSAARPRIARKRDKLEAKDDFNFSTWKKSTFEPWQATAKTATGGEGKKALTHPSTEAEQRMKDEAVRQIDARTNFPTKSAPKGTAERTRELEVVQHWVDHGEKYGRLRQIFGSAFVKVVKVYDSVKSKIEAKVAAAKTRIAKIGGGGIKGAVLTALRGVGATLLGIFIRDIGHRLVTSVEKGATVLLGNLFGEEVEAVEEQLKKIEEAEANFKKLIAEALDEKFGEQIKALEEKIKEIEEIADAVKDIDTIKNVIKWAYRIAQCGAPPLLGCVIALVATEAAELAIAAIVASCWFQREIAYPIVSALGPIRKLPGLAAKAIADRVRDLLPESVKPLIAEVDPSDLESKADDVDCQSGGKYDLDPAQQKLAELLQNYDQDHVKALMKALEHLGVASDDPDPDLKLTDDDIARVKKLLDTYTKAELEDIVTKSPARPPRKVASSDIFDALDAAAKTPTGRSGVAGPTAEEIKQEGAEVARRLKPLTSMPSSQDRFAPGDAQPGTTIFVFFASTVGQLKGGFQKLTVDSRDGDKSMKATIHAGTRFYNLKGELVETTKTTYTDEFEIVVEKGPSSAPAKTAGKKK